MLRLRRLSLAALLAVTACRTVPMTPQAALDALAAKPSSHLSGALVALGPPTVLNAEDFVYDARLSPDGHTAALSRLGMKSFFLSLFTLATTPPQKKADTAINRLEFDVESLDFSGDGAVVAAVSKDGTVRLFDAADGHLAGQALTEEPLVSVAFSPSGALLAVGSRKGLLTVLSWPGLHHVAEVRAHTDELRALVFGSDGRLYSGSWDRSLAVWTIGAAAEPSRSSRIRFEKRNGQLLVHGALDSRAVATFAIDERLPALVVNGALAQAVGIDVRSLTETVTVPTAFGDQLARVSKGHTLAFKSLGFEQLDVAVCDACVPSDAQGVLGRSALERFSFASDEATAELEITAKERAPGVIAASNQALTLARRFTYPASVNDLSIDAAGAVLGVAFSQTKAERTREVYEREKRKEVEPAREWDCGARVDAKTGQVLEKKHGHRGVVSTAAVSPDGKALVTGGWDKQLLLHGESSPVVEKFGWALRKVRFSRDGRWLVVAAWTPQNPLNDHQSDPSAVVYEVRYREAVVP